MRRRWFEGNFSNPYIPDTRLPLTVSGALIVIIGKIILKKEQVFKELRLKRKYVIRTKCRPSLHTVTGRGTKFKDA